jgi:hypothetical protein
MVSANNLDKDGEYSESGRTGPDLLRGLILPMMTTCFLVIVGFLLTGLIGLIITVLHDLFG